MKRGRVQGTKFAKKRVFRIHFETFSIFPAFVYFMLVNNQFIENVRIKLAICILANKVFILASSSKRPRTVICSSVWPEIVLDAELFHIFHLAVRPSLFNGRSMRTYEKKKADASLSVFIPDTIPIFRDVSLSLSRGRGLPGVGGLSPLRDSIGERLTS